MTYTTTITVTIKLGDTAIETTYQIKNIIIAESLSKQGGELFYSAIA